MPIQDFETASGNRIMAGKKGLVYSSTGQIHFVNAPVKGIDQNLWACLKIAVDQTGLFIRVNSVDTGAHVPGSRHYQGRAVDIDQVVRAGVDLGRLPASLSSANLTNREAAKFYRYLRENGFHIGEGRPWPAVIWGPPHSHINPTSINHSTHIHVSLPRNVATHP